MMAWIIPIANTNASTFLAADNLYLARQILLGHVDGTAADQQVIIDGTIAAASNDGLVLFGLNSTATIGATGVIRSMNNVGLGFTAADALAVNDGFIFGGGIAGIYLSSGGDPTTVSKVENNGTVEGTHVGIIRYGGTEKISVVNTGTIKGGEFSFQQWVADAVAKDEILNTGKIAGAISFGGGDDLYDGRNGYIAGRILGGAGADKLYGGAENNRLEGGEGNDTLAGGAGADKLYGGDGTDTASYFTAKAGVGVSLASPSGNTGDAAGDAYSSIENLTGSAFKDKLAGNSAANVIKGGAGDDTIRGYEGNDTLSGEGGKDTFVFDKALNPATNVDMITDFKAVDDTIQLENAIFTALSTTGVLADAAFRANGTGLAGDSSDRIIYETDTGKIFYDRDGSGSSYDSVLFATLTTKPAITAADFIIA